jgi:hypothetical protein
MNFNHPPGQSVLLVIVLTALLGGRVAAETPPLTLVETRKIWDGAPHNAFTDLIRFKGAWICVFREGTAHVPGTNGVIRVLRSTDTKTWESAAAVSEAGIDLRDPKVSIAPDGRLMLLVGGSIYSGEEGQPNRKLTGAHTRVMFSSDTRTWTAPVPVSLPKGEWLWRVTWHEGIGYGVSYTTSTPRKEMIATLWKTKDGIQYERVVQLDVPCWPNETTVRFGPDGTMFALVRGEQEDRHAFFGRSAPPYQTWTWTDTGRAAQGPNFTARHDGQLLYSGRDVEGGAKTVVGELRQGICVPLVTFPSGGDCSYPGMAWDADDLLVSYYSSHEGKAAIYLGRLR